MKIFTASLLFLAASFSVFAADGGSQGDEKQVASRETFLESFYITHVEYGKDLAARVFPYDQNTVTDVKMAELKIEFLVRSGGCTKSSDFRVDTYFDFTSANLAIVRVKEDRCKAIAAPVRVTVTVSVPKYDDGADGLGSIHILNGTDESLPNPMQ